jgi:hypothetical protein
MAIKTACVIRSAAVFGTASYEKTEQPKSDCPEEKGDERAFEVVFHLNPIRAFAGVEGGTIFLRVNNAAGREGDCTGGLPFFLIFNKASLVSCSSIPPEGPNISPKGVANFAKIKASLRPASAYFSKFM